ncbi:hypothetical protein QUF80_10970 [Desulfococcaceae bacterium HSG8]|nr:hypothetical protein [Desulfococcaceae bacterium HSG8]
MKGLKIVSIFMITSLSFLCVPKLYGSERLIAVTYNTVANQNELYKITPVTGDASLLASVVFDTGTWSGMFSVDNESNRIYIISGGWTIYQFDSVTGALLSIFSANIPAGRDLQDLKCGDDVLIAVTYDTVASQNELYKITPVTGDASLLASIVFNTWSHFSVDNESNRIYMMSDGAIYQFDSVTGALLSTFSANIPSGSDLQALKCGGDLLVAVAYNTAANKNELYKITPGTGAASLLASIVFDTETWSGMSVDNESNRIYIRSGGGIIYQFDSVTGALLSTFSANIPTENDFQAFEISTATCYTRKELNQAVLEAVEAERRRWDINGDDKKGLEEAIDALQISSGIK